MTPAAFNFPQYYNILTDHCEFNIAAVPRSGSTSVHFMAKNNGGKMLPFDEIDDAICIVRHPLERLASAWLLFPEEARRLPEKRVVMRPPIEEVIDAILDEEETDEYFRSKISNSKHAYAWQRQVDLYSGCANPVWMRLEGNEGIFGILLPHYNAAETKKPKIEHRLEEITKYYAEDMKIWQMARTKIG